MGRDGGREPCSIPRSKRGRAWAALVLALGVCLADSSLGAAPPPVAPLPYVKNAT